MATIVTERDVIKMISSLSNWGRWGADDQLGTINLITPAKRKRATALVQEGRLAGGPRVLDAVVPRPRHRHARCRHRAHRGAGRHGALADRQRQPRRAGAGVRGSPALGVPAPDRAVLNGRLVD